MKQPIYITIAIAVFVLAACICLHAWFDEMVFVHRVCFHRYLGKATLIEAQYGGGCEWKPLDRPNLDNTWGNCTGLTEGQTYDYWEASYTCD